MFCPFFDRFFFFLIELNELYSGKLTLVSHIACKYFCPFSSSSSHFVYGFFAVRKLVSFIRYRLFIFVFVSSALGEWPKKTLIRLMSENVLTLSLLGVLYCHVLCLSLSHFEFVFLYSKRGCSNFIDLHVTVQLSPHFLQHLLFVHFLMMTSSVWGDSSLLFWLAFL